MYTLAIETANKTMSVAVLSNDTVLAIETQNNTLQHSVSLFPAIDKVLKAANITLKPLTKIAVSNGPGSYTGLRIGVMAAKTLGYTLNIPVYPVSSLAVLAHRFLQTMSITDFDGYIIPFFDARRDNVYAGIYTTQLKLVDKEAHLHFEELLEKVSLLDKPVQFISPDVAAFEKWLSGKAFMMNYPTAQDVAAVAQLVSPIEDIHILAPTYLKKAQAEEEWLAQNNRIQTELIERSNQV